MGGKLSCESEYGEGSTFYFALEQDIVEDTPIGAFEEKDSLDQANEVYVPLFVAPEAKVLVVDDNEMNLQVVKGLLQGTKVQLTMVMSGMECLEKVKTETFHVILLDHMMPQMDGIETLENLRKMNVTTPVYALTANAATNGSEFYKEKGFDGYLPKPVEGRQLEAVLAECIPKELQKEPDKEQFLKERDEEDSLAPLLEVEGISVEEGVKNCGGKESFATALATFYETLKDRHDEIANAYHKGDFDFYTIKVHALKSSARIIGAKHLSNLAERLEDAGKRKDFDFIHKHHAALLSNYLEYYDKLKAWKHPSDDSDKEPVDETMLADAYEAMKEFCEAMDYDSMEMVVESIAQYRLSKEDTARMEEITKRMKQLDWDGIKAILP
ncbi:MAG: response regulator [Lachnospiraceae bacterium]|nr:response regulator [Lachnospiraceae bacterium]